MSGDGLSTAVAGFGISTLVVHTTSRGEGRPLKGGNFPRLTEVGWIALGDDISSVTGLGSPTYGWRDTVWLSFDVVLYRLPRVFFDNINGGPDAIQWGMFNGATCTVYGISE